MIGLNAPALAKCEPDKSERHQDGARLPSTNAETASREHGLFVAFPISKPSPCAERSAVLERLSYDETLHNAGQQIFFV
jgi:hypothetical protein